MNKSYIKWICISCLAVFLFLTSTAYASIWQVDTSSNRTATASYGSRYLGDNSALRYLLNRVPNEFTGQSLEIDLPMPDGSLASYQIYESSIMQPGLAARFPDIKSYVVRGLDHPGSYGRVDISPKGFRGMIYTPFGRVFIDPVQDGSAQYFSRTSQNQARKNGFQCGVYDLGENRSSLRAFGQNSITGNRISGSITSYRLAVSATPEYVAAVSTSIPSLNDAMSEINTAINRVNQIYERDLGIRLLLVSGNDKLIDVQGNANFANDSTLLLLDQNQDWIDSEIGAASYDIGHIFSTGDGGAAQIQSVCGSSKAQGVTGLSNPTGDLFYIDFVAHEIGHQFGADHTFNGSSGVCGGERNAATAYEPGSGSTIMGYAGICGGEDLQASSEATFHAGSIDQINNFVGGLTCHATISANNPSEPVVNAGSDKVIPIQTAFWLEANASDADGDVLNYQWDQMDTGTGTNSGTLGDDLNNNAMFRTYEPFAFSRRDFPALGTQLDNLLDLSESLPCVDRTLDFRVTVRDGKSGQATDNLRLTINQSAGPFRITSHNTGGTIFINSGALTLTWDVANTDLAPVSCNNVDIDLLTFSNDDSSYAITPLLSSTTNDGSEQLTLPDMLSTRARFRVACSDNIFYDISDNHLTIQDSGAGTNFPDSGNNTFMNTKGLVFAAKGQECAGAVPATNGFGVSGGSGGGGSLHPFWLLALLMLVGVGRTYSYSVVLRACKWF